MPTPASGSQVGLLFLSGVELFALPVSQGTRFPTSAYPKRARTRKHEEVLEVLRKYFFLLTVNTGLFQQRISSGGYL